MGGRSAGSDLDWAPGVEAAAMGQGGERTDWSAGGGVVSVAGRTVDEVRASLGLGPHPQPGYGGRLAESISWPNGDQGIVVHAAWQRNPRTAWLLPRGMQLAPGSSVWTSEAAGGVLHVAPEHRQQGVSVHDTEAVGVWRMGGAPGLADWLPGLRSPVLCPLCDGHGAVRHGGEGKTAWFATCDLCTGRQRVSDCERVEEAVRGMRAPDRRPVLSKSAACLPHEVGAGAQPDIHGWGSPLASTLDDRVAERLEQAAHQVTTSGAFDWRDPRTMPVGWPWEPQR